MTQKEQTMGWETEFDEKFSFGGRIGRIEYSDDIKQFIRSLLTTAKQEQEKQFEENLRNAMDKYNDLPDGSIQFGFVLKAEDTKKFFDAIRKGGV